jgi:hypothetical protein
MSFDILRDFNIISLKFEVLILDRASIETIGPLLGP